MIVSLRTPVRAPVSRRATVSTPRPCKALRVVTLKAKDAEGPLANVGDALKNAAADAKEKVDEIGDTIAEGAANLQEEATNKAEAAKYDAKQQQRETLYGGSGQGAQEKLGGAAGKHTSRSGADPKQQTGGGP